MDLDDPRQPGALEQPLDLRPRQAEFLANVLLCPTVDIRPVGNPGQQLVVVRGQVVGQRRDLVTGVSNCSVSGRLLTLSSSIPDRKMPAGEAWSVVPASPILARVT